MARHKQLSSVPALSGSCSPMPGGVVSPQGPWLPQGSPASLCGSEERPQLSEGRHVTTGAPAVLHAAIFHSLCPAWVQKGSGADRLTFNMESAPKGWLAQGVSTSEAFSEASARGSVDSAEVTVPHVDEAWGICSALVSGWCDSADASRAHLPNSPAGQSSCETQLSPPFLHKQSSGPWRGPCPQLEMRRGLSGTEPPPWLTRDRQEYSCRDHSHVLGSSTSTQNCVSGLSHDVNTKCQHGLRQAPGISHFQVNNQCKVGVTQARGFLRTGKEGDLLHT